MTVLLIVIYLAFIGLGLPDSLLGSAWPVMRLDIGSQLSAAGIISLIICGGTIISALCGNRVIHRFGTHRVTFVSVLMTALSLLGMAYSPSFLGLCLFAVPLGLGAGSIDAALNNFVALNYKASHMNWLHCSWGVGATTGPIVMSFFMRESIGWRGGYMAVSGMLFAVALVLLFSLPLWKESKHYPQVGEQDRRAEIITNRQALSIRGVKYALASFLCYCGCELSAGLWAASYLVEQRGLDGATAATWASLYYGGITVGRFISGFAAAKLRGYCLIRLGCSVCLIGAVILILPLPAVYALMGLVLIGFGCAPFYPAMIHETPGRFGEENSQAAMGLQMASAYIGSTFLPPFVGALSKYFTLAILPWFLLTLIVGMLAFSERLSFKPSSSPKPRYGRRPLRRP
ncbi:MFS transporter [Synergistales bacterium]|nr:MFS transporter [Synergistales bacterium]